MSRINRAQNGFPIRLPDSTMRKALRGPLLHFFEQLRPSIPGMRMSVTDNVELLQVHGCQGFIAARRKNHFPFPNA